MSQSYSDSVSDSADDCYLFISSIYLFIYCDNLALTDDCQSVRLPYTEFAFKFKTRMANRVEPDQMSSLEVVILKFTVFKVEQILGQKLEG